ncbi:MAG: hypothetical protein NTU98_03370 [Bacteroidetes bacterium]|nr:hypothetical protein [Bacteroidota bacterium]
MKSKRKRIRHLLVLVLLAVLGTSCTVEQKLGKDFLTQTPQINIELLSPEGLYKYNHKGEEIAGFDSMTGPQQDSALYADSRFIKNVDDSIFLDRYVNSFIEELRALGFKVYVDGIDSLFKFQPQSYIVNLAQVQLDEYYQPFEDSEPIGDSVFYKTYELNAVDASAWIEVNKFNVVKPVKTVLYSSFTGSDGFSGSFVEDGFNIRYRYKIDSLDMHDVYNLASFSGRRHANYLYDYFMNQYIVRNMPSGFDILGYLHYDRQRKAFYFTDDEKFDVLQPK